MVIDVTMGKAVTKLEARWLFHLRNSKLAFRRTCCRKTTSLIPHRTCQPKLENVQLILRKIPSDSMQKAWFDENTRIKDILAWRRSFVFFETQAYCNELAQEKRAITSILVIFENFAYSSSWMIYNSSKGTVCQIVSIWLKHDKGLVLHENKMRRINSGYCNPHILFDFDDLPFVKKACFGIFNWKNHKQYEPGRYVTWWEEHTHTRVDWSSQWQSLTLTGPWTKWCQPVLLPLVTSWLKL